MSRIVDRIKRIFGLQSQIQTMVQPSVVVNAGTQVLKAVKPHAPMIKFRAGSGVNVTGHSSAGSSIQSPITRTPKDTTAVASSSVTLMEDWQLPLRYRRRPLSQEEVDCINGGGAP